MLKMHDYSKIRFWEVLFVICHFFSYQVEDQQQRCLVSGTEYLIITKDPENGDQRRMRKSSSRRKKKDKEWW